MFSYIINYMSTYWALYFGRNLINDSLFLSNSFLTVRQFKVPLRKKRYTLLRSSHIFKTSQEAFEFISYKTVIKVNFPLYLTTFLEKPLLLFLFCSFKSIRSFLGLNFKYFKINAFISN